MNYPEATTIHLVRDNRNIHRRKSWTDCYGEELGNELWDRFPMHDTPRPGSWLQQAEIEISLFSRPCLGKRRLPHRKTLRRETRACKRRIHRARTKINWPFNRKAARRKFGYKKHFSNRIFAVRHKGSWEVL